MKNLKKIILLLIASSVIVSIHSCKDHDDDHDHDDHDHENELITTIKLTFTNTISSSKHTFAWRQPNGVGTAITVDTIKLPVDSSYNVSVSVLDESKNPAEDVTEEIRELDTEHQFFYTSTTDRLVISNRDNDAKGLPLGLTFTAQTSSSGNVLGSLRAVLKHYTEAAPKSNDPQAGSTDADVTFPVRIE